jgi:hypothetical protein
MIIVFCIPLSLFSQDTSAVQISKDNYRVNRPLYVFGGLDGLGVGVTFFGIADFQYGILLLEQTAKAKIFLFNKNSTPYIGYGIGEQFSGFGGNGESNKWKLAILGWQFSPFNEDGFYEFSLQYILEEENKKAFFPTVISFSAGIRI